MIHRAPWMLVGCALAFAAAVGCDSGKTVYVKRGAGMLGLEGNVGDERVLADGTRVIIVDEMPSKAKEKGDGAAVKFIEYGDPEPAWTGGPLTMSAVPLAVPTKKKEPPPKDFEPRKELGGGRVRYQAIMPEHVLSNLIECLRNKEYAPFYEQMLADETRTAYDSVGGVTAFEAWAEANREPLLVFLNRMGSSWAGSQVIPMQVSKLRIRYSLDKRDIPNVRFHYVEISMEHGGCRLAMVQ